MSASSLREVAELQIAFRGQNDRSYASAALSSTPDRISFVCECADPHCCAPLRLSAAEFGLITQDPCRFFNISGHEEAAVDAGAERVLLAVGEFTVVVKIGVAGEIAAAARNARTM